MRRLLIIPAEPLARFRLFSVWFASTIALFNVGLFIFDSSIDPPLRIGAGIAAGLLGAWWLTGYLRGGFPTAGWLVDMVLVAFVASVSPMPLRAVGFFYAGIQFRALYGPRREAMLLCAAYAIARVASIVLGPHDPSFDIFSLTSIVQVLALTIIAVTLHLFVEATERHVVIERALERSDERYRLVASAMRDVVYDWHVPTGTIEWTESMQHVFGFDRGAVGKELAWWIDRVHPDDRAGLERVVRSTLDDPTVSVGTVRYRVRRADESYAHVSGSIIVQRSATGGAERVIGSIRDITSEQRLEEQLRQSQKMEAVGQLAGGVAHDFNNLLTVIGGHVFMLDHELEESPSTRKHLDGISRATERAASLTRQLLAFSRKQILTPSVVELNAVVDDVLHMMQPVIGEHTRIVTRLDPSLSPVLADAGKLGQVLVNLALNARDAMPNGGTLTIATENRTLEPRPGDATAPALPPGDYVQLTMRDTGVGMDATTLERAFEPFFTTKGPGQGSGLGLATAYGIVKQSFGDIHATSKPGIGSTFVVLLPVAPRGADAPPAIVQRAPVVRSSSDEQGRSVLLVEDDDGVRDFAQKVLARAGYQVHSARNGTEAIAQVETPGFEIDVLVTDVVMPEMSGRELAEHLRRREPELPVLYITGYSEDVPMLSDLRNVNSRLLEKPFTAGALTLALEELSDGASQPMRAGVLNAGTPS